MQQQSLELTFIKQKHNTGSLFYRVTEHGSFISYNACMGRVMPWHLLDSGTRQKETFIMMCYFVFLFCVKTAGLWALIAVCVTPFQPPNQCTVLWPPFNLRISALCCVTPFQPPNQCTDFSKLRHKHYGGHSLAVNFSFLQSVVTTWRTRELVSCSRH